MDRTTVRMTTETRQKLRQLASDCDESMQDVLAKAVEAYRRQVFLEKANEEFADLRADPDAWRAEAAERALWDATLADGLGEV